MRWAALSLDNEEFLQKDVDGNGALCHNAFPVTCCGEMTTESFARCLLLPEEQMNREVRKHRGGTGIPVCIRKAELLRRSSAAFLHQTRNLIRKQHQNQIRELVEANAQLRKEVDRQKDLKLEFYARNLEDVLRSLKEILKQRDQERCTLEKKVLANVRQLILPYLEHLRHAGLADRYQACVEIIESNLNDLASPFSARLSSSLLRLTPTEIRVANLVKEGRSSKEIAELFSLSQRTIDVHRDRIRKKLGLKNKRENLRTHLFHLE